VLLAVADETEELALPVLETVVELIMLGNNAELCPTEDAAELGAAMRAGCALALAGGDDTLGGGARMGADDALTVVVKVMVVTEDGFEDGAAREGGVDETAEEVVCEVGEAGARTGGAEGVFVEGSAHSSDEDVEDGAGLGAQEGSDAEFGLGCRPARRWCSRAMA
jgi:hypothetical protein